MGVLGGACPVGPNGKPIGFGEDVEEADPSDPLAHTFYGDTQAFIAVKTDLVPTILEEGFKAKTRDFVACASNPMTSVYGLSKSQPDCNDITVLEVHGVDPAVIDVPNGKINARWLEAKHLRDGVFFQRGAGDYANAPCPLCGQSMRHKADERGRCGLHRYTNKGFVCTPCDNPDCMEMQRKRQKRLDQGKTVWLYHMTSRENADLIKNAGGKMIRGAGGNAGGGIYFGTSPNDCWWKAMSRGVILKCRVQIGYGLGHNACKDHTFADLVKDCKDCVWGHVRYLTKSYIVYSWDQIQVAAEVDYNGDVIG